MARLVVLGVLALVLWAAFASPAKADTYTTHDFRNVVNTTTGAASVPLCGEGGQGIWFNTSDQQAGSCIDGSAFTPGIQVVGSRVYVPMGSALTALRETGCLTASYYKCASTAIAQCGRAQLWQIFDLQLNYLGQSDTLGGVPTPIQKVSVVCPTPTQSVTAGVEPTSSPTRSVTTTSVITSTPTLTPVQRTPSVTASTPCLRLPCATQTTPTITTTNPTVTVTILSASATPTPSPFPSFTTVPSQTSTPFATAAPSYTPVTYAPSPSPSRIPATLTPGRAPVVTITRPRAGTTVVAYTSSATPLAASPTHTVTTHTPASPAAPVTTGDKATGILALGAAVGAIWLKARGWIASKWASLKSAWKR